MSNEQTTSRIATGKVVSNKMDKTLVILVERKVKHPKYGKYITRSTKLYAHDADNKCNIGDVVKVKETRPYSKSKNWELLEVITTGQA